MFKALFGVAIPALLLTACSMVEFEGHTTTLSRSVPVAGEEVLEVDLDVPVGRLEIESGSAGNLYEFDLDYNELAFTPDVDFQKRGNTGILRFRLSSEGKSFRRMGKNRLNLRLNPEVPIVLRTKTGVGESQIDLGGMSIRELDIENGVGETSVSMLEPNRISCDRVEIQNGVGALKITGLGNLACKQLRFQGGVGGSELDFSGEWNQEGEIEIAVGVGGVDLRLPRSIGAEVKASRSFMSGVSLPEFEKRGDTYISYNADRVSKVLRLRIEAGIGGVNLRWL
ncbi:MAG TPA: toast rack family protein [Acidobacteriota bacterium]|jgi:hypothetical protein|nr:toast rack family protein [Acidobacteriota bacterium]